MKTELVTNLNKIFEREVVDSATEDKFSSLAVKYKSIIESADAKLRQEIVSAIETFIMEDETQKRKLLSFCIDFYDPTAQPKTVTQNGEEIQLNSYLHQDDLYKLYQFVKRHESDSSFGDTVYNVMGRHNMTAPQVYKGALLRRQDFSRATDPKVKNVTKQIAWQIIIGLHCSLEETDEVLFSAGYIRRKTKFDLTMEYFIRHETYDIMAINDVLVELNLKPFSCYKSVKDNDNQ